MHYFGTNRALLLVRLQRRLATRTDILQRQCERLARDVAFNLRLKLVHQPDRVKILPQRKTPGRQSAAGIYQV